MAVDRWIPRHPTSLGDSRPYTVYTSIVLFCLAASSVFRGFGCSRHQAAEDSMNLGLFTPSGRAVSPALRSTRNTANTGDQTPSSGGASESWCVAAKPQDVVHPVRLCFRLPTPPNQRRPGSPFLTPCPTCRGCHHPAVAPASPTIGQ